MRKIFLFSAIVIAVMTVHAKVIDLKTTGTTIGEWTNNAATLNTTETDPAIGKYVYDIKGGVASESFVTNEPDIVFSNSNKSDKTKAFTIYPGKCFEFGGKNGILMVKNTNAGDTITLTAAAKGTTAADFEDPEEVYPKNAVLLSQEHLLPAKNSGGGDGQGYVWRDLVYVSKGGDVEIKEFAGGYRIVSVAIDAPASEPAGEQVITWGCDELNTFTKEYYYPGESVTIKGITVTVNQGDQYIQPVVGYCDVGFYAKNSNQAFTFSTESGFIKKIECTAVFAYGSYGEGWDDATWTWTGNAKSVHFGNAGSVLAVSNIIFTIGSDSVPEPSPVTAYTLQLVVNDSAMGAVALTNHFGSDIIDNGDGTYTVPPYAEVSILATPKEGYEFAGWKEGNYCDFTECVFSGSDMNVTDNPLYYTVTGSVAIMAVFRSSGSGQLPDGMEDVQSDKMPCSKVLVDGVLYILRGNRLYSLQGAQAR